MTPIRPIRPIGPILPIRPYAFRPVAQPRANDADSPRVQYEAPFIDILNEKLGAHQYERPVAAGPARYTSAVSSGFFFLYSGATPTAHPGTNGLRTWATSGIPATASHVAAPRRPQRTLSSRQRRALDDLITLGAGLGPDFTLDELRSAFRTLARRYHPDRHPGSSDAEKSRLSLQFTQLHNAYRHLQSAS